MHMPDRPALAGVLHRPPLAAESDRFWAGAQDHDVKIDVF